MVEALPFSEVDGYGGVCVRVSGSGAGAMGCFRVVLRCSGAHYAAMRAVEKCHELVLSTETAAVVVWKLSIHEGAVRATTTVLEAPPLLPLVSQYG